MKYNVLITKKRAAKTNQDTIGDHDVIVDDGVLALSNGGIKFISKNISKIV